MSNQPPYGDAQGQPGPPPEGFPPPTPPGQGGGATPLPDGPPQGGFPSAPPAGDAQGGYPNAPQGGYQSAPQMSPGGYGQPPADVVKPKSIDLAVKLMYAGAGLAVINIILAFFMKGTIKDKVREQLEKDNKSLDDLDTIVNSAIIVSVVVGLIAVALWIFMARSNDAGKSWARIVATVLGGLSILSFLGSLTQDTTTGVTLAFSIISLILAAAILFFLWKKESSQYYAAKSAPRH
ncbi:hypothetical protein [Luteipulveratus mongoliensis]|uniref:Uncharacterized protein n=1 Tax=Luteipulveratus mongoliensis TaxID=571913 RepID=A0A0K1JLN8_9MICO|nr:hypothetical protein [Luteipulveratus mongoliensis]AKU17626.1 hypothetical protein VV02_20235 [Luteipulveratus mongoliensis]